ncbi:L-threonylcarbamoyladenylate synthase [Zavarzinia sp. CC-PAN008]|uniref:L-threonylcarbamoyladenylate synthase n=1 Tax=Zavarzinia sp. CC-PAN008 TaxID=3243332 RepID=UPI003F748FD5
MTPRIAQPDLEAIAEGARLLRLGALVAFPTETVYGLGADAGNDRAVAAIYAAKGRPSFNPLIAHVPDLQAAQALADFDPLALRLAHAFWPGGLTLVLPRRAEARLSHLVTAGLETVAVRVPAHPVALALLAAAGVPVAAPSANPSGRLSPTEAQAVADGFGDALPLVIDGGRCPVGLESTVLATQGGRATLLRPGAIPRDAIEAIAGPLLVPDVDANRPASPGQLASHYAPRLPLRLDATEVRVGEALLAFGPASAPGPAHALLNLSPTADLVEAAANLFAMLRRLDASGASAIAVMPIPSHGLGEAIRDRLTRAAAPRGPTS